MGIKEAGICRLLSLSSPFRSVIRSSISPECRAPLQLVPNRVVVEPVQHLKTVNLETSQCITSCLVVFFHGCSCKRCANHLQYRSLQLMPSRYDICWTTVKGFGTLIWLLRRPSSQCQCLVVPFSRRLPNLPITPANRKSPCSSCSGRVDRCKVIQRVQPLPAPRKLIDQCRCCSRCTVSSVTVTDAVPITPQTDGS